MYQPTASNSVQQREKLVEVVLTKDGSALLKVLEILKTRECGYVELVDKLFADMDAIEKSKSARSTSKQCGNVCDCLLEIAIK